jgi:hypothetical protein
MESLATVEPLAELIKTTSSCFTCKTYLRNYTTYHTVSITAGQSNQIINIREVSIFASILYNNRYEEIELRVEYFIAFVDLTI